MTDGRKMTNGHHMSEIGYFTRFCDESRGWIIHSLHSRKIVVSQNAYVVRGPNTRHARLALSDDLIGRRGVLETAPAANRNAVRALFAHSLVEPQGAALIADAPLSGVPVLARALDADSTSWHPSSLCQGLATTPPRQSWT